MKFINIFLSVTLMFFLNINSTNEQTTQSNHDSSKSSGNEPKSSSSSDDSSSDVSVLTKSETQSESEVETLKELLNDNSSESNNKTYSAHMTGEISCNSNIRNGMAQRVELSAEIREFRHASRSMHTPYGGLRNDSLYHYMEELCKNNLVRDSRENSITNVRELKNDKELFQQFQSQTQTIAQAFIKYLINDSLEHALKLDDVDKMSYVLIKNSSDKPHPLSDKLNDSLKVTMHELHKLSYAADGTFVGLKVYGERGGIDFEKTHEKEYQAARIITDYLERMMPDSYLNEIKMRAEQGIPGFKEILHERTTPLHQRIPGKIAGFFENFTTNVKNSLTLPKYIPPDFDQVIRNNSFNKDYLECIKLAKEGEVDKARTIVQKYADQSYAHKYSNAVFNQRYYMIEKAAQGAYNKYVAKSIAKNKSIVVQKNISPEKSQGLQNIKQLVVSDAQQTSVGQTNALELTATIIVPEIDIKEFLDNNPATSLVTTLNDLHNIAVICEGNGLKDIADGLKEVAESLKCYGLNFAEGVGDSIVDTIRFMQCLKEHPKETLTDVAMAMGKMARFIGALSMDSELMLIMPEIERANIEHYSKKLDDIFHAMAERWSEASGPERSKMVGHIVGDILVQTAINKGVGNLKTTIAETYKCAKRLELAEEFSKAFTKSLAEAAAESPLKTASSEVIAGAEATGKAAAAQEISVAKNAVEAVKQEVSQVVEKTLKDASKYATTENKLKHFFEGNLHDHSTFAPLLKQMGGTGVGALDIKNGIAEKVVNEVIKGLIKSDKLPLAGRFEDILVNVQGYTISVRGVVHEGVIKIGTMFIS